jgi:hypothetical protein
MAQGKGKKTRQRGKKAQERIIAATPTPIEDDNADDTDNQFETPDLIQLPHINNQQIFPCTRRPFQYFRRQYL